MRSWGKINLKLTIYGWKEYSPSQSRKGSFLKQPSQLSGATLILNFGVGPHGRLVTQERILHVYRHRISMGVGTRSLQELPKTAFFWGVMAAMASTQEFGMPRIDGIQVSITGEM